MVKNFSKDQKKNTIKPEEYKEWDNWNYFSNLNNNNLSIKEISVIINERFCL